MVFEAEEPASVGYKTDEKLKPRIRRKQNCRKENCKITRLQQQQVLLLGARDYKDANNTQHYTQACQRNHLARHMD